MQETQTAGHAEREEREALGNAPRRLRNIRKTSALFKIRTRNKELEEWHAQDYSHREITRAIQTIKLNTSHGNDGAIEELYRTVAPWIAELFRRLLDKIKTDENCLTGGKRGCNSTHIQTKRGRCPMWWLPTNIISTCNIQNMAQLTNIQNQENIAYGHL